ncbi:hypothetical protein AVEN_44970-1 [Araneus ventricosus]|uniref:Uncharacterized protein n=1 Tax=Araneus ventricosus TaxID=182803 RepID=A0A4Y2R4S8_ARAVE|nr:hypothetical protein AVEN_162301-1 [Araneus ventricosus]GBN70648.1 hypothetical protein AVEN_44970-1 [Araneus ventricosus]
MIRTTHEMASHFPYLRTTLARGHLIHGYRFNTLTPKPAVTVHATSILVGRISAGCFSEKGEKAAGRVGIKGTFRGEMKGCHSYLPPSVVRRKRGTGRTNPFHRSISKQTSVCNCIQILRTLSSQSVNMHQTFFSDLVHVRGLAYPFALD